MGKVEPSAVRLYRMRTLTVLCLLDGMVVAVVDDLLFSYHHLFHAVDKSPADAAAVSCVDETVLRTCVEGIFSVNELRMKHNITLL